MIEHAPPQGIKEISGTEIRDKKGHGNWENEGGSNLDNLSEDTYEGGHY